jgi:outer membrane lipoprotein-sorting protein
MIRLVYIIILALLASPAISQDEATAKKILDEFSKKLNTYQSVKANFTFTDINLRVNTRDSYEGDITFKGEMFRLNILETETWFNGKTLWNYLPDVNEVNVTEPDQDDDAILNNPFHLFHSYESRFKYGFPGEEYDGGNVVYEIDLIPMDLGVEYSRIRIRILKSSMELLSAQYFRKDGNHYLIEISGLSINLDLPDTYFSFQVSEHPGVEVIDLR